MPMDKNISILIEKHQKEFNCYFKNLLESNLTKNKLSKAMLYGTLNGGKRIRPFLVFIFAKLTKLPSKQFLRVSAAVECIHSYSLIHDDLPSMDNDDYRRGKPSVHKKFNEALAILAGDSLHDIAFELLADKKTHKESDVRIQLIHELSLSLGSKGLVGGQSLDISYENRKINQSKILEMYKMKTAALFRFCCLAPFIMTSQSSNKLKFAKHYGNLFGLIFQIIDDYLDEESSFSKIGKTPGKDKKLGKSTLIQYMNKSDVIPYCESLITKFIEKHKKYFAEWEILQDLFFNITNVNKSKK